MAWEFELHAQTDDHYKQYHYNRQIYSDKVLIKAGTVKPLKTHNDVFLSNQYLE